MRITCLAQASEVGVLIFMGVCGQLHARSGRCYVEDSSVCYDVMT